MGKCVDNIRAPRAMIRNTEAKEPLACISGQLRTRETCMSPAWRDPERTHTCERNRSRKVRELSCPKRQEETSRAEPVVVYMPALQSGRPSGQRLRTSRSDVLHGLAAEHRGGQQQAAHVRTF